MKTIKIKLSGSDGLDTDNIIKKFCEAVEETTAPKDRIALSVVVKHRRRSFIGELWRALNP